ncbi:CASP-like protein 4D1 [Prosopis cineraria]|uniref:CASP-like protein 4D1 n=1 Tax=Prosopis cineraria TaxID=364024 RepID=UPI00240FE352|nr:CASP-like protein 4D1 [Prosopis cineraria]
MASQRVANSMLVLRIIALAASVATIALVVTNNVKFESLNDFEWKFQDIMAFRYVLAAAAISAAYGLIQLPFAVYYAVKQKRLIRNGCLSDFDFIGDKVISLVLASAVGAGIGVSYEIKKSLEDTFKSEGIPKSDPIRSTANKFLDRGIIASSVLALACLCMAIVSLISSIHRSRSRGGLFN